MTTSATQKAGDHTMISRGGPMEAKNFTSRRLFWRFRSPGTLSTVTRIVWPPAEKFQESTWTLRPSAAFRYGSSASTRIVVTPEAVSLTQTWRLLETFSSPAFLIVASIEAWNTDGFEIGVIVRSTGRGSEDPENATSRSGDVVPA